MDGGIKGDSAKLVKLGLALDSLPAKFGRDLNVNLADAARTQVANEFRDSVDPYGKAWPPAYRGGQTLAHRGRLRNSFTYRATATGFRIGTNLIYAAPHQYGAVIRAKKAKYLRFKLRVGSRIRRASGRGKRLRLAGKAEDGTLEAQPRHRLYAWIQVKQVTIPKRQMIPEDSTGPIWDAAMKEVVDDLLAKHIPES